MNWELDLRNISYSATSQRGVGINLHPSLPCWRCSSCAEGLLGLRIPLFHLKLTVPCGSGKFNSLLKRLLNFVFFHL